MVHTQKMEKLVIFKWILYDPFRLNIKSHVNLQYIIVLRMYNTFICFEPRTAWTGCASTCRLPRRLAYGILQSTAAQYLPPGPANWWYPYYPVSAWQISCAKSAGSNNMDARATSCAKLPSWSGIFSSGTPCTYKLCSYEVWPWGSEKRKQARQS